MSKTDKVPFFDLSFVCVNMYGGLTCQIQQGDLYNASYTFCNRKSKFPVFFVKDIWKDTLDIQKGLIIKIFSILSKERFPWAFLVMVSRRKTHSVHRGSPLSPVSSCWNPSSFYIIKKEAGKWRPAPLCGTNERWEDFRTCLEGMYSNQMQFR